MKLKLLKSLTLASLLAPLMLLSADDDQRVPVGSRPKAMMDAETDFRDECGYIFDRYPTVYLPASTHWFTGVSATGDSAVIDDGSVWLLSSYDSYKAFGWITNDPNYIIPLTVTQNFSWFSNYRYRIINKNTGESIAANLQLGPLKDNPNTRFVTAVDPGTGTVVLNDNTRYQVSPSDAYKMPALFDYVIRGQNGGWSSTYESILINVNMDNYVHARQI